MTTLGGGGTGGARSSGGARLRFDVNTTDALNSFRKLRGEIENTAKIAGSLRAQFSGQLGGNGGVFGSFTTSLQQAVNQAQSFRRASDDLGRGLDGIRRNGGSAAESMGAFGRSLRDVFGSGIGAGLGFFAVNAVASLVAEIQQIGPASAQAADAVKRLDSSLRFAFRGSVDSARAARQDILKIANELGVNSRQLGATYSDIAIGARPAGLSRSTISEFVGGVSRLGLQTGARDVDIQRALYQVQQGLALGRFTGQDYKALTQNVGSIDDVLAAGLSQIRGKQVTQGDVRRLVTSGEVTAAQFVEAFTAGLKPLEGELGSLPKTVEQSRARLSNEFDQLLATFGSQSSDFIQGWNTFLAAVLKQGRATIGGETTQEKIERLTRTAKSYETPLNSYASAKVGPLPNDSSEADVRAAAKRELEAVLRRQAQEQERERAQEGRNTIVSRLQGARTIADELNLLQPTRADLTQRLRQVEEVLALGGNLGEADRGLFSTTAATLRSQLRRTLSPAEQVAQSIRFTRADAGLGLRADIAARARELVNSQEDVGLGLKEGQARALTARQDASSIFSQAIQNQRRIGLDRQFLLPAAGQGGFAEAVAEIERQAAELAEVLQDGGKDALEAIEAQRKTALERLNLEQDIAERNRRILQGLDLDALRRREGVIGRPGAERELQRDLRLEAELRDARPEDQAGIRARDRERRAQEDRNTIVERLRAQEAINEELRLQNGLELGLGRAAEARRRIAQEELRYKRDGLVLTEEQRRAIEETVRLEESVRERAFRGALLDDSARTISTTFRGAITDGLVEGFETGTIRGRTILQAFGRATTRILSNSLELAFRPLEQALSQFITSFASNLAGRLFGGGGSGGGSSVPYNQQYFAAHGAVFAKGRVVPLAHGGVVTRPVLFPMANGMGLMGEAGPEAVVPLARGPDGRLGVRAQGGGGGGAPVTINVIDQRSGDAERPEVNERSGPNGERIIEVFVREQVRGEIGRGSFDREMNARYGAQRQIKQT